MRRLAAATLALLHLGTAVQAADTSPYFRFGFGRNGGGLPGTTTPSDPTGPTTPTTPPTTPTGPTTPTDPGTTPTTPGSPGTASLAFANATPIPSGGTGDARTGTYAASGGTAPYTMSLTNAPPSLSLSSASADGSSYVLSGDLGPTPGSYRTARILLRDASGGAVSYGVPLDVLDVPDRPGPAPLAVTSEDLPATFNAGSKTYANASASGGTAPYTWTVTNAPATMAVGASPNSPSGAYVQAFAAIGQPGSYQDVVLTVRDAAGQTASRTFAPFQVAASGTFTPIAIGSIETPPATLAAGGTWTSQPFTVTGGSGSYQVLLDSGPASGSFQVLPAGGNSYRLSYAPTSDDVGRYGGVTLTARDADSRQAVAPVGPTTVPASAPLTLVEQAGPLTVGPGTYDPVVNGRFSGGSGSYNVEVFGNPNDFSFYLGAYAQAGAGGVQDLMMAAYSMTPGTYADRLVQVSDAKTGERLPLSRFAVTVTGGGPGGGTLSGCTSGWTDSPITTLNVEDTINNWDGIRVSGGQAPFSVEYDSGAIPSGMGFAIQPEQTYALANGMTGLNVSFRPTAPGEFHSVPVRVRDSAGGSCDVTVSAKANPKGTGY